MGIQVSADEQADGSYVLSIVESATKTVLYAGVSLTIVPYSAPVPTPAPTPAPTPTPTPAPGTPNIGGIQPGDTFTAPDAGT